MYQQSNQMSERRILQQVTNTFSALFISITFLIDLLRPNFHFTLAGLELVSESTITKVWKLILIAMDVYFILLVLFTWIRCSLRIAHIRSIAIAERAPTRLFAPNCHHLEGPRKISNRNWVGMLGIVTKSAFTSVLLGLSFAYDRIQVFCTFLFLCTFISLLIHVTHYQGMNVQNSSLNRLSSGLLAVLSETLLVQCSGYDYNAQKILVGLGRTNTRNVLSLDGGYYVGRQFKDPYPSRLTPGLLQREFIVYANERFIIRIFDANVEQVKQLVTAIRYSTGESNHNVLLTTGTIAWMYALLHLCGDLFGPGPWPRVNSLESTAIWISLVGVIGRVLNTTFGIAYVRLPLSGRAEPDLPEICRWTDARNNMWQIYSDSAGIVRARIFGTETQPAKDIPVKIPIHQQNEDIAPEPNQLFNHNSHISTRAPKAESVGTDDILDLNEFGGVIK